jgi:hypothetical protein
MKISKESNFDSSKERAIRESIEEARGVIEKENKRKHLII